MNKKLASALLIVGIACLGLGVCSYLRPKAQMDGPKEQLNTSSKKVVWSKDIEVPAKQMWLDTGVDVTGKYVRIEYKSGEWSNGGDDPHFYNASGVKPAKGDGKKLLPKLLDRNAVLNELIGKTDKGLIEIGDKKEGELGTGRLYLSINDIPGDFNDNLGSIIVTVSFLE